MKKLKGELKYGKKGITLIALVITIIVLLILAGVSIATLAGENGILTRANDAKETTEHAKEDELRQLTAIEAATYLEEHGYEDPSGETITIPAQCAVSQVEGENTLEDGLVIIDANGNEWTWIEVSKGEMPEGLNFENDVDYTTLENALHTYTNEYRTGSSSQVLDCSDTWYRGCGIESPEEYNKLYKNMLKSIYENGGFWISRFEAGIEGSNTNTTLARYSHTDVSSVAVSKKSHIPYNYVNVSEAQKLSTDIRPNSTNKTSLMFGIQWDLICKYLENNLKLQENTLAIDYILKNDSRIIGNYSNSSLKLNNGMYNIEPYNESHKEWTKYNIDTINYVENMQTSEDINYKQLLTTGASEQTKTMNIYDLAGNVWEMTLEASGESNPFIIRGGYAYNSSETYPMAYRNVNGITNPNHSIGFRIALY